MLYSPPDLQVNGSKHLRLKVPKPTEALGRYSYFTCKFHVERIELTRWAGQESLHWSSCKYLCNECEEIVFLWNIWLFVLRISANFTCVPVCLHRLIYIWQEPTKSHYLSKTLKTAFIKAGATLVFQLSILNFTLSTAHPWHTGPTNQQIIYRVKWVRSS